MKEFLITVAVAAPFLLMLGWAFSRNERRHQLNRRQALVMLEGVLTAKTPHPRWILFLGQPITHDPELEAIRLHCLRLQEGDNENPPARSGIGGHIFDRAGRARLEVIVQDLRELIASEPYKRSF